MIFGAVDMHLLSDAEAYSKPPFLDYTDKMPLFFAGLFGIKLFHAFLLSYLHERIPRCPSSCLWSKVWPFSLLAFFLVFGPGLLMTAFTMTVNPIMTASWAINGLIQTFAASFVIIPILYSYPASNTSCESK